MRPAGRVLPWLDCYSISDFRGLLIQSVLPRGPLITALAVQNLFPNHPKEATKMNLPGFTAEHSLHLLSRRSFRGMKISTQSATIRPAAPAESGALFLWPKCWCPPAPCRLAANGNWARDCVSLSGPDVTCTAVLCSPPTSVTCGPCLPSSGQNWYTVCTPRGPSPFGYESYTKRCVLGPPIPSA